MPLAVSRTAQIGDLSCALEAAAARGEAPGAVGAQRRIVPGVGSSGSTEARRRAVNRFLGSIAIQALFSARPIAAVERKLVDNEITLPARE